MICHNVACLMWRSGGIALGAELDGLELGARIDSCENLVHSKHGLVLQFRITTLAALKDGQSLENHDRGVSDLERKIRCPALQQAATNEASHHAR